jgi:rubrerythrin
MTNDPESTNAQLLASAELCGRLRYNASIWQRKADDDHPLVKDQLDAANAIDRLAYQAQGYCKDAKHAESVADELRRLLEKEKERADKFMWQVRDTCARAEAAETALAAEKRAREEALAENARLARLVYVPGQWRCAKCKFTLIQANLNANDGTVTARDQPGDKCPNCDSPLWRVTERDAGNEMIDRAVEAFEAKRAAETHSAALARALEELVTKVDAFWNDPERPSVHRMRSKSVHELSDAQRRAQSLLAPKEDTDT